MHKPRILCTLAALLILCAALDELNGKKHGVNTCL